ncbi:hypothetical protein WJX74_010034 [Apatococcus lobatus]|uniref:Uncharacterized protein n=2 Tax=Apatococcus TaxID=904362 RepID=A0AAW1SVY5_9CHLO
MRHRHTYTLQEVGEAGQEGGSVRLTNPNGVQLVTQTHVHRAPDKRFGEPEELMKDSHEKCAAWKQQLGRLSPCMNDADGQYGKTWIRALHAEGLWTHGGSIKTPELGWAQIGDGLHVGDVPGGCALPTCNRSDPAALHIYHFRSPSIDDDIKKNKDWHWRDSPDLDLAMDAAVYARDNWFFNLVYDAALLRFGGQLQVQVATLLS